MRSLALTALLLAAPAAGGEIRRQVGPVQLRGIQPEMHGPVGTDEVSFPEPGWIKGYSVHVRDARGESADELGILCHTVFRDPSSASASRSPLIDGARTIGVLLTSTEGAADVRLPAGFGLAVDTVTRYSFDGALQSQYGPKDGDYTFEVRYDFQPFTEEPALKALTVMRVEAQTTHKGYYASQWKVPPGRHTYEGEFGTASDLAVHLIDFHLHRFVTKLELLDVASGRALYSAELKKGRDGYPIRPVYSSVDGFPLKKGARYRFRVDYDNTTDVADLTMAQMFLFVSGSPR
jgi:hypothetical protein